MRIAECRACGGPCRAIAPLPPPPVPIGRVLADAMSFPWRGHGRWIVSSGGVFFLGLDLASNLLITGIFFSAIAVGAGTTYLLEVTRATADGAEEPPDWPDITQFWRHLIAPILLVVGVIAVCFAPAFVVGYGLSPIGWIDTFIVWLVAALGTGLAPACWIAVALSRSFEALNPAPLIRGARQMGREYALIWGLWAGGIAAVALLSAITSAVPWAGPALAGFAHLYLAIVIAHATGLLYRRHAVALGWFDP